MRIRRLSIYLAAASFSAAVSAETPPDVTDLIGAKSAGGETQLMSRGYEQRDSNVVRDQRFTFWWNPKRQQCLSVSTVQGRYASIEPVPAANCGGQTGGVTNAAPQDPNSLVLVCYGAGTRPTIKSDSKYAWDEDQKKWKSHDELNSTAEGFTSDVQIELYGDHGRIHLGKGLVPPINSGGDNGWWELNNLQVGADRISAGYRLNGMNKPQLTVDRRSGRVTIEGLTKFSGQCDIGNYGGSQRRF